MANSYRLGTVHSNYLTPSELQTEFRDYKLKVLNGEIDFKPSINALEKHKDILNFISDTLPNDIISGSLALNLLGLIYRPTNDIDILIDNKNRYPKYVKDGYDDDEFSTPNRLGYVDFKYKKKSLIGIERLQIFPKYKEYKVDFFYNDNVASFITIDFNGKQLKVHNPLEIMDYKLNMAINTKVYSVTSRKHNEDLTQIFGQMSWQLV
jgi:hypothetical protein